MSGSACGIGRWAKEAMSSGVGRIVGSSVGCCVVAALPDEALGAEVCAGFFHAQAKCLFRYVLSTAASNYTQIGQDKFHSKDLRRLTRYALR